MEMSFRAFVCLFVLILEYLKNVILNVSLWLACHVCFKSVHLYIGGEWNFACGVERTERSYFRKLNSNMAFQKLSWLTKIINRPHGSFHIDILSEREFKSRRMSYYVQIVKPFEANA